MPHAAELGEAALPRVSRAQGASCAGVWDGANISARPGRKGGSPLKAILGRTCLDWLHGGPPLHSARGQYGARLTGTPRLTGGLGSSGRVAFGACLLSVGKCPLFVILPLSAASSARPRLPSSTSLSASPSSPMAGPGTGAAGDSPTAPSPRQHGEVGVAGALRGAQCWEIIPANPERDGSTLQCPSDYAGIAFCCQSRCAELGLWCQSGCAGLAF